MNRRLVRRANTIERMQAQDQGVHDPGWISDNLGEPIVDLEDKDALSAVLNGDHD